MACRAVSYTHLDVYKRQGSVFEEGGWAEATTVGQTFATFGLLGGIISGIIAINYCANQGWTTEIRKVKDMPEEVRVGLVPEKDVYKRQL